MEKFFCRSGHFKYYLCAVAKTGKDIQLASELLKAGKLVAIPTETVYGLAANALSEKAVIGIFSAKQRPLFDPLIIHVHSIESVKLYASLEDERLQNLAARFWPGPLTLLLPKKEIIPDLVTSGLNEVAVRIPRHPLTLELLEKLNLPLAAPSANPFGYVSPTTPAHVELKMGDKIDYILDGGDCKVGIESTIVGIENNRVCIFRLGGLAVEAIEKVVGRVELRINMSGDPRAPGQLSHHYAPRKKLYMGKPADLIRRFEGKKIALISYGPHPYLVGPTFDFNLSVKGDLEEAAINLFSCLRKADASAAEIVICETVPNEGLGMAINDRLRRASAG